MNGHSSSSSCSSQVGLYCHSATCVDIQWNEMLCLTGPRCYMNTDIQQWRNLRINLQTTNLRLSTRSSVCEKCRELIEDSVLLQVACTPQHFELHTKVWQFFPVMWGGVGGVGGLYGASERGGVIWVYYNVCYTNVKCVIPMLSHRQLSNNNGIKTKLYQVVKLQEFFYLKLQNCTGTEECSR